MCTKRARDTIQVFDAETEELDPASNDPEGAGYLWNAVEPELERFLLDLDLTATRPRATATASRTAPSAPCWARA